MISINTTHTFPETCDRKNREHNVKKYGNDATFFIRKDIMLSVIGPVLSRKRKKKNIKI